MEKIAVIGTGRIGLPLALVLAEAGFYVFGVDVNKDLIQKLEKKEMPFMENGAEELLKKHLGKRFFPTSDFNVIKDADSVILTLGTPVDEHFSPDYSQIESIKPILSHNLKKDQLLILRSTVSPGTTEFMKDFLEKETGLVCGKDFFMAYCPERIAEGKALEEIKEVPQIIGGITSECSIKAKELFSKITGKCLISDAKSAELAKIFSNMYRYINFAIANEFAILSMEHNRNIYEIIELVNRDYKRGGLSKPGFSAGPCLYKDGFFLLDTMPFDELISVSWKINENLPVYLVKKIRDMLDIRGKKVAILGMAFKKNIDDIRNSLSFKLKKAFLRAGSEVCLHDPFVPEYSTDLGKAIKDSDIVVIAMNHDIYSHLKKEDIRKMSGKEVIICDIWNVTGNKEIISRIK